MDGYTYGALGIDIVDRANFLGGLHYGCGLDGDAVTESLSLTIDYAGYENVASDSMSLRGFNYDVVR